MRAECSVFIIVHLFFAMKNSKASKLQFHAPSHHVSQFSRFLCTMVFVHCSHHHENPGSHYILEDVVFIHCYPEQKIYSYDIEGARPVPCVNACCYSNVVLGHVGLTLT